MKPETTIRLLEEKFRKDIAEIIAIQKETEKKREKWVIERKKWEKKQEKWQEEREKERKQRAIEREKALKKREKALEIEQKEQKERTRKWDKGMEELRATQRETKRELQKTSQETSKLDKALNKFIGFEGSRWGKLGENLVKGNLAKRLRERGIKNISRALTNVRIKDVEYDIIVVNGKEAVIVEVKANLKASHVRDFIESINKFKTYWPLFKDHIIYGAIAYLIKSTKRAEELAEAEGFFVIEAVGDVIIKNKKSFKQKEFAC